MNTGIHTLDRRYNRTGSTGTNRKRQAGYRYSFALLLAVVLLISGYSSHAQSAAITVDCAADKGLLFRYEAYNNLSGVNTGAATRDVDFAFLNSAGLHSKILRVWISESIYNRTNGTYIYSNYDTYVQHASTLADELLIVIPGNTMVDSWNYTPDQCKPILKNIIRHFKETFPKVKYVEALNEPDLYNSGSTMTSDVVYSYYKPFYQIVNELNVELGLGTNPLLVGGPTITSFKYAGDEWLRKFLDGYKNDTDPSKKLDFITYHTYSYKRYPKEIETIRPKLEQWLSTRGLPTNIPSFITEVGLFPGADVSGSEEDDALRQAAGMAAYAYWMSTSNKNIPFNWVVRHAAEVRKDQMVTRPKVYSDRLTPYGNMMRMMSMMKTQRISATTNVMDADGMGVYGMASHDATGLSIMAWNYQHTGLKDYNTSIKVLDLPAIFNGKAIRKKIYKIDQTTSNNYYAVSNCNLQLVSDTTIANPGTNLNLSIGILNENSIQLIVLEPVAAVATNTFGLQVAREGNSAMLSWATQNEANSTQFEVLHSTDGSNFTQINTVTAAGNSSTPKAYSFLHTSPVAGINYYKVVLVHNDGSKVPSGIVSIFMNLVEATTHIYYDFGNTGAEHGNPVSGVPAGWTASAVSVGNATSPTSFFTSTSASNTYPGFSGQGNITMSARRGSVSGRTVTYSNVTTVITPSPFNALSYYEVTITPAATQAAKIEAISFGSRSIGQQGGPANIIIRSSLDGFTNDIYSRDISAGSNWIMVNASFPTLTGAIGQAITIRIYANDAITPNGNNWRIDDLDITATMGMVLSPVHTFSVREEPANKVLLQWQTSSETDVARFEVLRSGDGTTFSSIGQVTAVGNSTTTSRYNFTDQTPLPGINYYQVKMVKSNNAESYTDVQSIFLAAWNTTNIYYNFGNTGSENGSPTSGVPDGWTASDVTAGNTTRTSDFYTSVSATGTYTGASQQGNITAIAKGGSLNGRTVTYSGVTTNIPPSGINALSFFQVQVEPSLDQLVSINSISFGTRSIGMFGGPANVIIRTSLDNFSSNVFSQNINAESVWELVSATFGTPLKGAAGQAITIRIYGNDAIGSASNNNWRIDDLDIAVTYTPAPGLPVSLTHFSAALQQDGVAVKWQTTSETNNKHFTVERSADGRSFSSIATVEGKGSSSAINNYSYLDKEPLPFTSYYRLKQTDEDGHITYYGPVVVRNAFHSGLKVYTTSSSVNAMLTSAIEAKATIRLLDVNGRQLAQQSLSIQKGTNNISIQLPLSSGIYMFEISGEGVSGIRKFIK